MARELSESERVTILENTVREAIEVYLHYIDPGNHVSRDDALNDFIAIFDRMDVARAAYVDPTEPGRALNERRRRPPKVSRPNLRIV